MRASRGLLWTGCLAVLVGLGCGESEVAGSNRPPSLEVPETFQAKEGEAFTFAVKASDPDDDTLDLRAGELPPGATFDPGAGVFAWNVPFNAARAAAYAIAFTADDGRLPVQGSVAVTITDVNQAPVLFVPPSRQVNEGAELRFEVPVTDGDTEDTVVITSPNRPDGASFDGHTFVWTPTFEQAGSYTVDFQASDDHALSPPLSAAGAAQITVNNVSRRPVFSRLVVIRDGVTDAAIVLSDAQTETSVSIDEASASALELTALSPEGLPVSFSASGLPAGATFTFSGFTTRIGWTPGCRALGRYAMAAVAFDADGADWLGLDLTVRETNCAPAVAAPLSIQGVEGGIVTFTVVPSDPDDDLLEMTAVQLPAGATFDDESGLLVWTVPYTAARATPYLVSFIVDDSTATSGASTSLLIGDTNRAPVVNVAPDRTIDEGAILAFAVTVTDADTEDRPTLAAQGLPRGATFDGAQFSWTPDYAQNGLYEVRFVATDHHVLSPPLTSSATVEILVLDESRPPAVSFSPQGTGTGFDTYSTNEGSPLSFSAVAVDADSDTVEWVVEWADGAGTSIDVPSGVRFNRATGAFFWTPSYFAVGQYQVTFVALDSGGAKGVKNAYVTVIDVDTLPSVTLTGGATRTLSEGTPMAPIVADGFDADSDLIAIHVTWRHSDCAVAGANAPISTLPGAQRLSVGGARGVANANLGWTPNDAAWDAGSAYCFVFTADDTTGATRYSTPAEVSVTVDDVPICADGVKNAAESDTDCGGGACPRCGTGDRCGLPSDCASSTCTSNVCQAPCQANNQCDVGLVCNGGLCMACGSTSQCDVGDVCRAGSCGDCTLTTQCFYGLVCVSGTCVNCASESQCAVGQACISGRCGPCSLNSDCINGQVCRLQECQPCTAASQCDGNLGCNNGQCGACVTDGACGTGNVCEIITGTCRAARAPALTYRNAVYTIQVPIVPNVPTNTGDAATQCTGTLPQGLGLSPNCTISGTPTKLTPTATYTITARNVAGSTTAQVTITVNCDALGFFAGGGGTSNSDPLLITTLPHLRKVRDNLTCFYKLGTDFDLAAATDFAPIGGIADGTRFTGGFNGGDHSIKNWSWSAPATQAVGFFGGTEGATIENLRLVDVNVTGGNFTGGAVGFFWRTQMTRVSTTGTVSGVDNVGGLVGYFESYNCYGECNLVSRSYSTATVNGQDTVGGLVGLAYGAVYNSFAQGAVTGRDNVGGLLGVTSSGIWKTYAAVGTVTGRNNVGGLAGVVNSGCPCVTHSFSAGLVSGTSVGGIVGARPGPAGPYQLYWDVSRSGQSQGIGATTYQGGVTGVNSADSQPLFFFNTGNVPYLNGAGSIDNWDFVYVWIMPGGLSYPALR